VRANGLYCLVPEAGGSVAADNKLRIVNTHVVGMALDADVVVTLSEQRSHAAESLLRAYFNAAEPLSKKPASRKLMTSPSRPLRTSTSPRAISGASACSNSFGVQSGRRSRPGGATATTGTALRTSTVSSIATVLDRSAVG
jgi:hypothetical protein